MHLLKRKDANALLKSMASGDASHWRGRQQLAKLNALAKASWQRQLCATPVWLCSSRWAWEWPADRCPLGEAYHILGTAHAARGRLTEIAGLYVLAAGTRVLPQRFRITKYGVEVRRVLVLRWLVRLLGLANYALFSTSRHVSEMNP